MAEGNLPIVTITPVFNFNSDHFERAKLSIAQNQTQNDLWVICIDGKSELSEEDLVHLSQDALGQNLNLVVLKSPFPQGAGNTRNYALQWCEKNFSQRSNFKGLILTFLDFDDYYEADFFKIVRGHFLHSTGVVTYSYYRKSREKKLKVEFNNDFLNYKEFLFDYCASCLSTAVLVEDLSFFRNHMFGRRFRANDQLFFLEVVKTFGGIDRRKEVVATYNVGCGETVSGNKFKMPYYKMRALHDHGLNCILISRCMLSYAIHGLKTSMRES